jgi:subfamily B ATP-binding cassette protein MsbA
MMSQTEKTKEPEQSKFKIMWFFLRPYKLQVLALFILAVIAGLLETATAASIYPVVSLGLNIESVQDNSLLSLIMRLSEVSPLRDSFITFCILAIVLAILAFAFKSLNLYFTVHLGVTVVTRMKENVFQKQLRADYQYFIEEKQGRLVYNTVVAARDIEVLIISVAKIMSEVILVISIFALLFTMNWKGSMLAVLLAGGYYLVIRHIGINISYATSKGRVKTATTEIVILNELIDGIKQVKVNLLEADWARKFQTAVRQYYAFLKKGRVWSEIPSPGLWMGLFVFLSIVAIILRAQNPAGFTPLVPLLGTFAFAMLRMLGPITSLGTLRMQIMSAMPNAELTYWTLQKRFDTIQDGDTELKSFDREIRFEHVEFTHKDRSATIKDVDITLEKGKITAIVGPSGAGKTTVVDLLLRLYDPDKGEIKIDGINIKKYRISSWLSKIGLVSQDTFIFHDSVKNNITLGIEGYSEEQIFQAAESANAHDFILEFPQGYDTMVGERGMKLSGGQKQRIAIARAILKKPEILILDEATSNLDNISEASVQEAISRISKERTVIIIAHRLSTIINADKIVVLDSGQVVEEGKHKQLMARKGAYWKLYRIQEKV